ncbi:acetylornithine deacetylase [Mobilicoccus caccae]|uniref:Acetylornithine deacetylase n=1 Tax=Mobilicoccus caccae TaxID=1859295 RepID=A0ABQ6ISX1_9MICO|nr:acetylornithine deacetylase [Mobilicoccus caccae]GMA39783.1 acetylornithine deacetylase [Mobilicoccus caccae]
MDRSEGPEPASLAWVTRLVSIDTTSRDSNLELIELVAEELRSHGVTPHILPNAEGTKANLLATVPASDGSRSGGVMLSGHTDVVPVDGQEWTSDPFTPQVRDGRLYGRGTCDMKAFSAVALHLLPRMVESDLREPIHLALSYDEEVGCVGGAEIVKQIADLGLSPEVCVVGEPTNMRIIKAHKSINLIRVTFTGVAAHSSLTAQGVNAIEHAARFITRVRDMADGWREEGPYDEAYPLAYTTASVNIVSGGIAGNTVPDRCVVELEFRSIAANDPAEIVDRIRGFAAEVERRMRAENDAASVQVDVLAQVPGLDAEPDTAASRLAVALGAHDSDEKVTYGTEAGQFAGSGIETIVCGPGDIAQAHAADEFIELSQIEQCEAFMNRLIDHLSEGIAS